MERINIEEKGILFKQIVTGPAPVGRILNYIKLAGRGVLKHVNGNRTTNLMDNVGYAWTTEYLMGLEVAFIGRMADKGNYLELTDNGRKVFDILKNINIDFNEGTNIGSVNDVRNEIEKNCPELFFVFEEVFRDSVVFKILKNYLEENDYEYDKREFLDRYFNDLKSMYDISDTKEWTKENRTTTLTTGANRVPSLLQLCQFFNYVIEDKGKIIFIKEQFTKENVNVNITYNQEELQKAITYQENVIREIENLEEKFGFDGNVVKEAIVRNSTVQQMFRNNLFAEYGERCMICGITNKELLVASHIKPSAESNVYDKINNNNGLLLCANHDRLFDRYLITFNCFNGSLEASNKLSKEDREKLGINKKVVLDEKLLNDERREFLGLHNIEFHNKNGGNN